MPEWGSCRTDSPDPTFRLLFQSCILLILECGFTIPSIPPVRAMAPKSRLLIQMSTYHYRTSHKYAIISSHVLSVTPVEYHLRVPAKSIHRDSATACPQVQHDSGCSIMNGTCCVNSTTVALCASGNHDGTNPATWSFYNCSDADETCQWGIRS